MALTKRSTKGSPLTHAEMDANWEYLDSKQGTNGTDGNNGLDGSPGDSVEVKVLGSTEGVVTRIDVNTASAEAVITRSEGSTIVLNLVSDYMVSGYVDNGYSI